MYGEPEMHFSSGLDDHGTRYTFYRDLVDMWEDAVRIINGSIQTDENKRRIIRLQTAIELVNNQIEVMSNYGGKKHSLAFQIDSIPSARKLLT